MNEKLFIEKMRFDFVFNKKRPINDLFSRAVF